MDDKALFDAAAPSAATDRRRDASVTAGVRTFAFRGSSDPHEREIAVERPVQIAFGDIPFGVMMLTPLDLEDFAYGFSLTEGVIAGAADVRGIAARETPDGLIIDVALVGSKLHAHLARKRVMAGRTGCGVCGIEDLTVLARAVQCGSPAPRIALAAIERALMALEERQPLNAATRAVHGAAWCGFDGRVGLVREDVGRHNALDKLIGALLRAGLQADAGFLLITSRASFEMVEKAAAFGCRTLVAISAPTALAIERARALDLTLLGIARRDSVTAFHGAERVMVSEL